MAPLRKNVYHLEFDIGEEKPREANVMAVDLDEAIKKGREYFTHSNGVGELQKIEIICVVDVE